MDASPQIVANFHGVEILHSPMLAPNMIKAMNAGDYEGREIKLGLAAIPKGARLLEMGCGSGAVVAALNHNIALEATLSIEANPRLIPHIQALHAHNGLSQKIELRHAVVLANPDAGETVTFNVQGNFLGSSLYEKENKRLTKVEVPVLRYHELKESFPHDAIMMDIEGGELDFFRHADLSGVNVVIAEFHKGFYGWEGVYECRACLEAQGLEKDEDLSAGWVHVYRRP